MKSGNRYILFIFISIIIGTGLTLYIMRDQAADYLNEMTAVKKIASTLKVSTSSKDTIDTAMFNAPKFLALKNNVNKFDFDSICKTPVGQVLSVATSTSGQLATTTQILSCQQGNNMPFPLPTKNK